ncbi:putative eukaryotic translation initiation factor 5-2 [Arabidopsis thaliana]|jgi:translation initiation factor 5|uniref:Probable eukaryotic translation initiation factor 5-2 n=4 Tax=Arabidopsis TaxID=3701 RepID=IF5Z_ARATH|nr:Translation initiation factor IF2/IF5 [Arabidopsis thaliana]Q9S825.1 RecName: Full=Probable eukaryotic translation initiation factor 5-2; Short=eIF-5 2 [Arabidopsis thaliana]KAG7652084.1 W2 domain [Arabidopsis thaliana x Arabidopsis arenosa]KAG7659945.1 W2 domain [Arabidopsis suecica]AAF17676.1 F28K19.5 [Arabidopsis thaliana]AAG51628.1 putative eukaryotic translation initiation factor 5; 76444-77757 [Arabidopsis thaliana]AAL32772.1 putative eukaryotic translation initiation factor 5 [Arabi|eukprot:NP_177907.1 Translation initiation factor IF2/IF5 [Arabidopsis thaliana]
MALQNIGASNRNDAFYRYKMPKMVTKTEGKGNGIKTNIINNVEIAKALARPPSYTTKYFGCELGAQSKFDEKTGTSLVNGAHNTSKLAGLLENFIKKFVQCYGCGNPETEIIITKTQMVNLKCAACGFISEVDMRDKLTNFILKNPPEQKKVSKDKKAMRKAEKERLKEGELADEEQRKLKAKKKALSNGKDSKTSKNHSSDEDISPKHDENALEVDEDEDDDDGVEWQTDTSREAAEKRMMEQLSAKTAEMVMLSAMEVEEKKAPKSKSNGNVVKTENPPPQEKNLVQDMKEYLKKGSPISALKSFISSLSEPPQDIMDALFNALFDGVGKGFAKEVTKKKNYLAAAATMQEDGSQMHLLNSIGTFCGKNGNEEALKEVALVLKALYDQDIIEEEVVLDWYEKGLTGADKSSPVWKNVKPFVEWLQSAESESEEED